MTERNDRDNKNKYLIKGQEVVINCCRFYYYFFSFLLFPSPPRPEGKDEGRAGKGTGKRNVRIKLNIRMTEVKINNTGSQPATGFLIQTSSSRFGHFISLHYIPFPSVPSLRSSPFSHFISLHFILFPRLPFLARLFVQSLRSFSLQRALLSSLRSVFS